MPISRIAEMPSSRPRHDPGVALMATLFQAIANSDRLALLAEARAVAGESPNARSRSIGGLAGRAGMTRFAASRHLRLLEEAGFVVAERIGQAKTFRTTELAFQRVEDWLYQMTEPT